MNAPGIVPAQQPTGRAVLRSTTIAAAVAALILVTIVLPAEYGVDPTGVGRLLGLTEMGETKRRLALEEAAAEPLTSASRAADTAAVAATAPSTATVPSPGKRDTITFALAPGRGHEIKLAMREHARVTYEWTVAGGVVNYDTHADAPGIRYHGYAKGQQVAADSGSITAAFDGMHGWFWRNRGVASVTVTLRTKGDYHELKQMP